MNNGNYTDQDVYTDIILANGTRRPLYHVYPQTFNHATWQEWVRRNHKATMYVHLMEWTSPRGYTAKELRVSMRAECASDESNKYLATLGSCPGSEVQAFVDSFISLL